jgi:quercetin dioxygenase-like cupin family protein
MFRTLFTLFIGAAIGVCGLALAAPDAHDKEKVKRKIISEQEIAEKVDGKESKAITLEVTIEPGAGSMPHRHPGPVFGYILEGEYEWAIENQPVKKLKVGDTFYEPTGCLHRVSRNPGDKAVTRILVVMLPPKDAKQISIPEPAK